MAFNEDRWGFDALLASIQLGIGALGFTTGLREGPGKLSLGNKSVRDGGVECLNLVVVGHRGPKTEYIEPSPR
jgi:hypothetical protein